MKIISSYRFIIFLFAGLFFCAALKSQEGTTVTDSVFVDEADEEEGSNESLSLLNDTLELRYRSVVYDSFLVINSDKGFYYKRYLDSLLRASQIKFEKARAKLREDSLKSNPKTRRMKDGEEYEGSSDSWMLPYNSVFGLIFWIAAVALFGYLVYRLFLNNSSFFTRNRRNLADTNIRIEETEDLSDAERLLRNAIKNRQYRLAVRYLYLQTLSHLSDRKFIEINSNKTNYEYVNEMRRHRNANDFASLTLQYEYVWYGEYPVDENLFEFLQEGFTQFNKNIGH